MAGLGHVAVGMAAARVFVEAPEVRTSYWRAAVTFSVLSLSPDLDILAFHLDIPYEAPFGHRGASHSFVAALLAGLLCAALPDRAGGRRLRVFVLATLVVLTHGLLDTLTDGGMGSALLWPFSDARLFAPWRPLPVSPIGTHLLSLRGAYVIGFEALLFAPLWLWALWPRRPAASTNGPTR